MNLDPIWELKSAMNQPWVKNEYHKRFDKMICYSPIRMSDLKIHIQGYLDLATGFYDIKSLGRVGISSTYL
jgi:hypothetical protein